MSRVKEASTKKNMLSKICSQFQNKNKTTNSRRQKRELHCQDGAHNTQAQHIQQITHEMSARKSFIEERRRSKIEHP